MFNSICILGLGYIGLPTAVAFAQAGKKVIGVDTNAHTVATIQAGKAHIAEPHLNEAVQAVIQSGHLLATAQVQSADAFIIAVPTPFKASHQPDLQFIQQASQSIAPHLQKGNLVVLESTSPVGTTEQLADWLQRARPDLNILDDIYLAHCPERVLPGKIMTELFENDRIIGGLTEKATQQAVDLYQIFAKGECIATSARLAEMCKLTENSFRDVNVAFANELSLICDELNINVWELIRLANRHPRVNILQPGAGVGGHCIAVDPWFIVQQAPEQARLIRMAREVNDHKPDWVFHKVKSAVAEVAMAKAISPTEIKIACLGLTFKADVDDLRGSPALAITEKLSQWHKGELWAVEPHIHTLPHNLKGKVELVSLVQSVEEADVIVLLVDHQKFREIGKPKQYVVDTRGVW